MIKAIKKILGKSKLIREAYHRATFLGYLLIFDFFDFTKINLFMKVYPYSMVGYLRLSNAYEAAKQIEKNKIKGAFVECGVWKGGCAAVMSFVADRAKSDRKVWLLDSFEGLPEPTVEDGPKAKELALDKASGNLSAINSHVGPIEDVNKILLEILKLNPENIKINKGWFQDTLPKVREKIGPISLLRINGDWYESDKCCLDNLYDLVIPGGHIMMDDYGYWEGSRRALHEFFKERKINPELIKIDYTGVYFKKP